MTVSKAFAGAVSSTLARLGLTQREAAIRTRLNPGLVSNMCLGRVPGLGTLLQFTGHLEIDPAPLLAAAGYPRLDPPAAPRGGRARPQGSVEAAVDGGIIPPLLREATDFCLRIHGDSMWPHLREGDLVGVTAQTTAASGQVVVARVGDATTVKRLLRCRDRWQLEAFNPVYPPIFIDLDDPEVAILGVVAWHVHDWTESAGQGDRPPA